MAFALPTDGTDSNTTAIVQGYAARIIQAFSNRKLSEQLEKQGAGGMIARVDIHDRAWFNENQESRYYFVPSLIAVMLFLFSLILTSIGIVKEKEIGTIEQVMVTPIRKIEFILGKTIPYIITGYISMTIMLVVAFFVFGIQVKGSMVLFYVLSGFMFPIKNMPDPVQYATIVNPMRWYLEILRGIVMKGVGVKVLWPAIAAQFALAVAFIGFAWARFSKIL